MVNLCCCDRGDPRDVAKLSPNMRKEYACNKTTNIATNIFGGLLASGGIVMIVLFSKVIKRDDSLALACIGGVITAGGVATIIGGSYYNNMLNKRLLDPTDAVLTEKEIERNKRTRERNEHNDLMERNRGNNIGSEHVPPAFPRGRKA